MEDAAAVSRQLAARLGGSGLRARTDSAKASPLREGPPLISPRSLEASAQRGFPSQRDSVLRLLPAGLTLKRARKDPLDGGYPPGT